MPRGDDCKEQSIQNKSVTLGQDAIDFGNKTLLAPQDATDSGHGYLTERYRNRWLPGQELLAALMSGLQHPPIGWLRG